MTKIILVHPHAKDRTRTVEAGSVQERQYRNAGWTKRPERPKTAEKPTEKPTEKAAEKPEKET